MSNVDFYSSVGWVFTFYYSIISRIVNLDFLFDHKMDGCKIHLTFKSL
jgi:hypothetical protein